MRCALTVFAHNLKMVYIFSKVKTAQVCKKTAQVCKTPSKYAKKTPKYAKNCPSMQKNRPSMQKNCPSMQEILSKSKSGKKITRFRKHLLKQSTA